MLTDKGETGPYITHQVAKAFIGQGFIWSLFISVSRPEQRGQKRPAEERENNAVKKQMRKKKEGKWKMFRKEYSYPEYVKIFS